MSLGKEGYDNAEKFGKRAYDIFISQYNENDLELIGTFNNMANIFCYTKRQKEAKELLEKAEKICPGYFENQIKTDIDEDADFAYLVESLTHKILAVARSILS